MANDQSLVFPWRHINEGIEVYIKLTPKAARNAISGILTDEAGGSFLKVSVTAVPENNKANQALINLLSKSLRIAKRDIIIRSGMTSARKTILIYGIGESELKAIAIR